MLLEPKSTRDSYGITNYHQGLLYATSLLQAVAPNKIKFSFLPRKEQGENVPAFFRVSINAKLPLSPALLGATGYSLIKATQSISSNEVSWLGSLPNTPNNDFLENEPLEVTTVEKYFVWCFLEILAIEKAYHTLQFNLTTFINNNNFGGEITFNIEIPYNTPEYQKSNNILDGVSNDFINNELPIIYTNQAYTSFLRLISQENPFELPLNDATYLYAKTDGKLYYINALTSGEKEVGSGAIGSKWFVDFGTPDDQIGSVGDLYLNSDNGDLYKKNETTWGTAITNIKGVNGTGVDHLSLTTALPNGAIYTFWGDNLETDNLGTITVLNGEPGSVSSASSLQLTQIDAPSPVTDKVILYAKNDGKLYYMSSTGVELEVGANTENPATSNNTAISYLIAAIQGN